MNWLTVARDLKRRKARERNGLFVAEGVRTVEELARSPLVIDAALIAGRSVIDARGVALARALAARGVPVLEVSEPEFASAADTEHPQGILAIAQQPTRSFGDVAVQSTVRVLVLDAIQDPGNVGTLIRTAAAAGVAAVVALPGTVDVWNAKVVRSAVGTHFHFPVFAATVDDVRTFLAEHAVVLWGTAAGGTPLGAVHAPPRLAIVVGNEGAGLSAELRALCSDVVSLPMASGVESLNVAVAAGITLYALRP